MSCKMKRLENNVFAEYTCDQARELQEQWKKEFRDKNGTDEILSRKGWSEDHKPRDRMYDNYCKNIDEFLEKCKCHSTQSQ
jgi:hypothetical protein